MKKILAYLLTVFVVTTVYLQGSAGLVYAATATLSLSPSAGSFSQGCAVALDVVVDTAGVPTDGTDAVLTYDPTRFQVTSITNGKIYADYPGQKIDPQLGQISISGVASSNTPYTGKGTLATINMTVSPTAPIGITQINFAYDPSKTTLSNVVQSGTVTSILGQVTNGTYTIGTSGSCTGTPTITKTPPPIGGVDFITKPPPPITLAKSGDTKTTIILGVVGGALTLLGILGLALL